jgi:hypothetical protein
MTSAALVDLSNRIATNTLTAAQISALTTVLAEIAPTFPTPDQVGEAVEPLPEEILARIWISALYTIQQVGGGGAVPSAVGTTIVPNAAAATALDATTFAVGTPLVVQSFGAEFSLQPKGTLALDGSTVLASNLAGFVWLRGPTLIAQSAVAQLTWVVDLGNSTGLASDENTGLTAASPLLHKSEIYRRWGTWQPPLQGGSYSVQYLGADVDSSDPGLFQPFFSRGSSLTHFAALPAPSFTGSLLAVVAKNRATNAALKSTFAATTGAIAPNMMLVNATRGNSRAFASRLLGAGQWLISQPFTPWPGAATTPVMAEVDTWANGDAITGYVLPNVNLAQLAGHATVYQPGLAGGNHFATGITIFDPSPPFSPFIVDGRAAPVIVEAVVTRALEYSGPTAGVVAAIFNAMIVGSSAWRGYNGIIVSGGALGGILCQADHLILDQDVILQNGCAFNLTDSSLQGGAYNESTPAIELVGNFRQEVNGICYGPGAGGLNVEQGMLRYASAAVAAFPMVGPLALVSKTTAYSMATAAGVTTVHGGIALTPAALDAAAGAAGFGGLAFAGGASIQRLATQP